MRLAVSMTFSNVSKSTSCCPTQKSSLTSQSFRKKVLASNSATGCTRVQVSVRSKHPSNRQVARHQVGLQMLLLVLVQGDLDDGTVTHGRMDVDVTTGPQRDAATDILLDTS